MILLPMNNFYAAIFSSVGELVSWTSLDGVVAMKSRGYVDTSIIRSGTRG